MNSPDRILATVEGSDIVLGGDGVIRYMGPARVDSDGGRNVDRDPCWQPDTSYHHQGKPLDAQSVPYVVIPLGILERVGPIGLGCAVTVTHSVSKKTARGICGDLGPRLKKGEISCEMARRLGLNPSSTRGGDDRPLYLYEFHIGVPAVIDGVTYQLQPLHG